MVATGLTTHGMRRRLPQLLCSIDSMQAETTSTIRCF
jgi:hypothetical protein